MEEVKPQKKHAKFKQFHEKICEPTMKAIASMGYTRMTEIQEATLLPLIEGKDLVGIAKTGSGKTLAFLVPVLESLHRLGSSSNSTYALIISPTRELAIQIHEVLGSLLTYHNMTYGLVIGGVSRKREAEMLSNGVNILVATPGRLLDHMQSTKQFEFRQLKHLVIDEVDRILDFGFEEEIKRILRLLPSDRQTIFFSATLTNRARNLLATMTLRTEPIYVGVDDNSETSTVSGLQQFYATCPTEKRLVYLHNTLLKLKKKKVMVFFSSKSSVEFHYKFFKSFNSGINLLRIHGRLDQTLRTNSYFQFCQDEYAMLFCTDVASRGLDIPEVDYIIQYDSPDDAEEYIHRVGRTARGEGKTGKAILVLRPEELEFVTHLKNNRVPIEESTIPWNTFKDRQTNIENLIENDEDLYQAAVKAFTSYIRAYSLHTLRDIFDIYCLDIKAVATSFGCSKPPLVDLNLYIKKRKRLEK